MKKTLLFISLFALICACQNEASKEITLEEKQKIAEEIRQHQAKMLSIIDVSTMENFEKWVEEMVPGEDDSWMGEPAMWLNMLQFYPDIKTIYKVWERALEKRANTKMKVNKDYVSVISRESALYVSEGTFSIIDNQGASSGEMPITATIVYVKKDNEWKVLHIHYSWQEN